MSETGKLSLFIRPKYFICAYLNEYHIVATFVMFLLVSAFVKINVIIGPFMDYGLQVDKLVRNSVQRRSLMDVALR